MRRHRCTAGEPGDTGGANREGRTRLPCRIPVGSARGRYGTATVVVDPAWCDIEISAWQGRQSLSIDMDRRRFAPAVCFQAADYGTPTTLRGTRRKQGGNCPGHALRQACNRTGVAGSAKKRHAAFTGVATVPPVFLDNDSRGIR